MECEIEQAPKESKTTSNDELACIICGESSNGKHFCYKCYKQFANIVLYIQFLKIKNN